MSPASRAARVRDGAGWFALEGRGLLGVSGSDRVRWTDGMISADLKPLAPGPERSGCEALLLTPQGRIVSDLHALCLTEEIWLELPAAAVEEVSAQLARYVVADDVRIEDRSAAWRRFALEGPAARARLERAAGRPLALAPGSGVELPLAGAGSVVWAWGWSGEDAYQLLVPPEAADTVVAAIAEAGAPGEELVPGDADVLEVLRIEAGRPRLGAELGRDVLPAEVGLVGRAVSLSKGCYTGQEIVARMAARDAAAHRLMGIRLASDAPPPAGTPLLQAGEPVGELTSVCVSERAGAIGLGFVRRAAAEPGAPVQAGEVAGEIVALPFVPSA